MLAMAKSLNEYKDDYYMGVEQFVKFLGISVQTYYTIIRREKQPRPSTIWKIANKLKVHPREIEEFARPQREEE